MENNDWIIFDGNIVSADEPVVPAISRGLMYGDGVFETFRTYRGRTFLLEKHIERLNYGLEILGISFRLDLKQLQRLLSDLLDQKGLLDEHAIVRVQVWRDGKRGYQSDDADKAHFSLTATTFPSAFTKPKLVTVERRRIPSESLPSDVKFSNSINYILAAREAEQKGGDDALMQTVGGWISETTIANVFWIRDGKIFTPSVDCDLIPGITRDIVLQIIDRENLEVEAGKFCQEHIIKADTAWICNSVREILPIQKLDEHSLNTKNELLLMLKKRFAEFRDQNLKPLNDG